MSKSRLLHLAYLALILAVLGLLGTLTNIPFVTNYAFWFEFVAFVLLVLGLFIKGL